MTDQPISVLFVCLGNICRSPLAEGIFRDHVARAGWADRFVVDSAGTSAYHAGELPDVGSIKVAKARGLDITAQRSRVLTRDDLKRFDFIVAMDRSNHRNILKLGQLSDDRLVLARQFEPGASVLDVPDPYGGGINGFELVYDMLEASCPGMSGHFLSVGPRHR